LSAAVERHTVRSFDGTALRYYAAGEPGGPTLVLSPGLGGSVSVWRHLIEHFSPTLRVLTWDYRGLYGSSPAADSRDYGVAHHARDLVGLVEHERVSRPVLVGWSMGVQVNLELHRTHPDLACGMVAIHGTHADPMATAFDSPVAGGVAPWIFGAMRLVRSGLRDIGPPLARSELVSNSFVWGLQKLGWMSPDLDRDAFRVLAENWLQLDMGVYAEIFEQLSDHDARDLLASVRTPTLIIAGGSDRFTPLHLSERLVEALPDATLEVVPEATHFGLLEYPGEIAKAIEAFLEARLTPARSVAGDPEP